MAQQTSTTDHRFGLVMAISAGETFASVLVVRGVYFFTTYGSRVHFSDSLNLVMALVSGALYVGTALSSHGLARRYNERRILALSVITQIACFAGMFFWPSGGVIFAGQCISNASGGMKWPIVESYAAAGRTPREAARAVSLFNLVWAPFMIPAVFLGGPLIAWFGPGFFLIAACLSLPSLFFIARLRPRPVHLAHDHPDRPDGAGLAGLKALLASSRWSLFAAYLFLQILVPLLPGIFLSLKFSLVAATAMASLLEAGRLSAFVVLHVTHAWQGRRDILALSAVGLPIAFFVALLVHPAGPVVAGVVLFGLFDGLVYGAALYYAMVVKNASVDAGGVHESLIGAGATVGPMLGLAGERLAAGFTPAAGAVGGHVLGMGLGIGPTAALCVAMGLRALMPERPEKAGPP